MVILQYCSISYSLFQFVSKVLWVGYDQKDFATQKIVKFTRLIGRDFALKNLGTH